MATAKKSKSASKPSTARPTTETDNEAIAQLTADHARVKKLFKQYDRLAKSEADSSERQELAMTICAELTAHATAEEEIFYPAAREVLREEDLIDEAAVEHASAKDLIAQIESASPGDDLFDAKVKVLGEYINHHVKEEQNEMFPKIRRTSIDLTELGQRLMARKQELFASKHESAV